MSTFFTLHWCGMAEFPCSIKFCKFSLKTPSLPVKFVVFVRFGSLILDKKSDTSPSEHSRVILIMFKIQYKSD